MCERQLKVIKSNWGKIQWHLKKQKGTTKWIMVFFNGMWVRQVNFICGPTGSLLCSQEHGGDGDAGHLEQALAWQHVIISGPLPISVISTQNKRGRKSTGSHPVKTRYQEPLCWERVTDLFLKMHLKIKDRLL